MVFLENVKGLKSHDNGKTLQTVLETLKKLGYYPHWTILSSLDFGLPQKRERWYCVAFRNDVKFEWPKPIGGHPVLRDIIDLNDDNPSLAISKFELDRIDYHLPKLSLVIESNIAILNIIQIQKRKIWSVFFSKTRWVIKIPCWRSF